MSLKADCVELEMQGRDTMRIYDHHGALVAKRGNLRKQWKCRPVRSANTKDELVEALLQIDRLPLEVVLDAVGIENG